MYFVRHLGNFYTATDRANTHNGSTAPTELSTLDFCQQSAH